MEELDNYVGLHFKHHPADIQKMIRSMNNTTIAIPKDHEEKASKTRIRIWEKEVDLYMKRQESYNSNKHALYSVIWGQCSEAMQAKIKYDDSYDTIHENNDSLELIKMIKGIAYKCKSQKNGKEEQHKIVRVLRRDKKEQHKIVQVPRRGEEEQHKIVRVLSEGAKRKEEHESVGVLSEGAKRKEQHKIVQVRKKEQHKIVRVLREGAEKQQQEKQEDGYLLATVRGRELTVPSPLAGDHRVTTHEAQAGPISTMEEQMSKENKQAETGGKSNDGHDNKHDENDINFAFHMNNKQGHMIDQNRITIDSASTVSIFSNKKLLRNIRHCGTQRGLRVHSNGGFQDTHMIGDLPGFGPVWYNKESITNILSLAAVCKIRCVTMDTWEEAAIIVHKKNGDKMKFMETGNGLYY